jgi:hypothetical protein
MGLSLVTKAEYKAYAGITSTTQDTAIDSIIPKVSELVKTICNRTFIDYINDPKVEYYDGGTNSHLVTEYPLIAISTIEYSNDYGNTFSELVEFVDYVISKRDDTIKSINGNSFPYKINSYRITYTGGYEVVPADLKLAVLDLVTYYIRNDMAVHSNKAPGGNTVQIEYVVTTNLPAHIKRVLDLYTSSLA